MDASFEGGSAILRYDDMLGTALALPESDQAARAAKWRQLVDLLAQGRPFGASIPAEAIAFIGAARDDLGSELRREGLRTFADRNPDPALLRALGVGAPEVEATVADACPPDEPPVPPTIDARDAAQLIERIEAFRRVRSGDAPEPAAEQAPETSFRWEAGRDGALEWVSTTARGALIGLSIAQADGASEFGVDGQAAGAFRRRTAFRDARLCVPGSSAVAGDWRISAVPLFDELDGRFTGYRGSARRPRIDQVAPVPRTAAGEGVFGSPIPPDGLRQLVHELRTPLNAIVGFSEMIEGQHLGPASRGQRARASMIRAQAGRLIAAIEDLDTAARLHRGQVSGGDDAVELAPMLRDLHRRYAALAEDRGAALLLEGELPPSLVEGSRADLERMIGRLLAAVIGIIGFGEQLAVRMVEGAERVRIEVGRPALIEDVRELELLDPGYAPDGASPAAPLLGLGFALRLIRNLALALGGRFDIEERQLVLTLPRAEVELGATG